MSTKFTNMKRRKFTAKFKTKVVLDALKERESLAQLAQKYDLHPTQISNWKREFLSNADQVFGSPKSKKSEADQEKDQLLKVIGQQKVELDFLKEALR